MSYIEETKDIKKGKNEHWCVNCGKIIRKGKPSFEVKIRCFDGDVERTSHVCSVECLTEFEHQFDETDDEIDRMSNNWSSGQGFI